MSKKKKITFLFVAVIVIAIIAMWLYKIIPSGAEPLLTNNVYCQDEFLENCDGQIVQVNGWLFWTKGLSLCGLKKMQVLYPWGCDGPSIRAAEENYNILEGLEKINDAAIIVSITGKVKKGGQPCPQEYQCQSEYLPTIIEALSFQIIDN